MNDIDMQQQTSPEINDDNKPEEGLTFNWFNLFLGAAIAFSLGSGLIGDDWTYILYLAVVVIIHEMGHVIAGKSLGCFISEMQVFFLPFVSYKKPHDDDGNSWSNIKWSLGVLPLGGVTVFKSRVAADNDGAQDGVWTAAQSPYINDKPAWQRLLISAAGVIFNLATFLILYLLLPYLSVDAYDLFRPLAVLSLLLALLNILPVYPLDGGAVLFALYEMITGRKPSHTFTTICGWIGFVFIVLFFWVFPEWLGGTLESIFRFFFRN